MTRVVAIPVLTAFLIAGCATYSPQPREIRPAAKLIDNQFEPLATGAIRPRGWLKQQLELQANGLSGHLDEFWPDIRDSGWIGGDAEGWERAPYWLDGLVPLAYQLDDARLKKKVGRWMDYILTRQRKDGWLGPVGSKGYKDYDPWPRFVVLKAMAQYYEASGDARVVPAMQEFFRFLDKRLDKQPLFGWGEYRWMDGVWAAHWLYDRTGEDWLLPLAAKLHEQGYDWVGHFDDFQYRERVEKNHSLKTHGVNNAMGLKAGPVWYRQSRNRDDRESIYWAMKMLDTYHGQINGVFSADEHFAGLSPSQGSELCLVVEYMFSLETAIAALGDAGLAARLECIAFNALPATFKKDMWAHQYDQQVNQVLCKVDEDRPFATNGPEANIFGLEPNYGCCTANMHQGWPKFVSSLWMKSRDGLVALSYAPCEFSTEVRGKPVRVEVSTAYPFDNWVEILVEGEGEFALDLRLPSGVGKVAAGGGKLEEIEGDVYRLVRDWTGATRLNLHVPFWPSFERHFNNSGYFSYGPVVFALPVGEDWKKVGGEEPHADWEVYPTTRWNYAVVPPSGGRSSMSLYMTGGTSCGPFGPDNTALKMQVLARLLPGWELEHNAAGTLPVSPVQSSEPFTQLTLIPYGCTNLRVAEFPVLATEGRLAGKGVAR